MAIKGWRPTPYVALAAIQAFILIGAISYVAWPPSSGRSGVDAAFIAVALGVVLATVLLLPRLPSWALQAMLALTWLVVAALVAVRENGQAQLFLAVTIVLLPVFAMYYLPRRSAIVQVVLMLLAYLAALYVKFTSVGAVLFMLVIFAMVVGAVLVGGLRANDRRERLLIDYASDIVFHSAHGLIQWISPSVKDVLGWEPAELIGTSMPRLWHAEDYEKALAIRDAAYAGVAGVGVLRFHTRDDNYIWIEITFKPYSERGERGAVGTMRDVSDRVLAEQALMASEHEAREMAEREANQRQVISGLDEVKSRLFQNISHELRTPITMIQAPLQELLQDSTEVTRMSTRRRADLEAASRAAGRLQHLVDGLLDVARGQAGSLQTSIEPTDLAALTRDTAAMFRATAGQADVQINVSTVAFPPSVLVDRDVWVKVLTNLVSNAIKFTSRGEVDVSLRYSHETVELVVADTGVGIAADDLPRIFSRFQQAHNRSARGDVGSGIGLALVAELVRAAEGSVHVDSIVGVGTTFTVRMPAARSAERPAAVRRPSGAMLDAYLPLMAVGADEAELLAADGSAVESPGRVLLVEDHADLRAYVSRLLRTCGWAVTDVATAEEAQLLLADNDLLVTDVMLPGRMDGVGLVRWARQQQDLRWMPIIVLTAKAGMDSMIESLGAGADDFVAKPFHPEELLARVGTHLELALLRNAVLDEIGDRAENLQRALASNRVIGTALGILMASEALTADEAFSRLRETSQHLNRKLRDVADDVIYTGALPATPSGQDVDSKPIVDA